MYRGYRGQSHCIAATYRHKLAEEVDGALCRPSVAATISADDSIDIQLRNRGIYSSFGGAYRCRPLPPVAVLSISGVSITIKLLSLVSGSTSVDNPPRRHSLANCCLSTAEGRPLNLRSHSISRLAVIRGGNGAVRYLLPPLWSRRAHSSCPHRLQALSDLWTLLRTAGEAHQVSPHSASDIWRMTTS